MPEKSKQKLHQLSVLRHAIKKSLGIKRGSSSKSIEDHVACSARILWNQCTDSDRQELSKIDLKLVECPFIARPFPSWIGHEEIAYVFLHPERGASNANEGAASRV